MPALKTLRDASIEDVEARLAELKNDFVEMSEGRRAEVDDDALKAMIREVDTLDTWLTMSAAYEERQQRKLAATAGAATGKGVRSYGHALVNEDFLRAVARDGGAAFQTTRVPDNHGGYRNASAVHLGEFSWGDEVAAEVSRWLRVAGMYSPDSGLRAVTEWGSGGPPTFDSTDSGGLLPRLGQPIPPVPRQAKLYLRDLIPSMTTTLGTPMPYVRELNPVANEGAPSGGGATTVAEGSTKPSAALSFASESAAITTVATTLTLSKQMFQDAPAVIQYINQRLPYLVKLREDQQFLSGSGTWPDIQGFTNLGSGPGTSGGILSVTGTSGEHAISIGNGFAAIENQDGMVTAVVMNPTDAWAMFTKRAAGGSGTFDAGTPFSALPLTVWGVPTYRSRVYATGSCLVADFDRSAMVVDREQVNTNVYNERYAEQNLVLLITEERLGMMVFRPDLLAQVTLP